MKHINWFIILIITMASLSQGIAQNDTCAQGQDDDGDGICNIEDVCEGHDDLFDIDEDGIPYYCDDCIDINENGICDTDNDPDSFGDHKVFYSKKRGFYEHPFSLELVSKDPSAQIRYTTNGEVPTPTSGTVYNSPISITTTSFVRAIAYTTTDTSKVYTHTYIYAADVINQPNFIPNIPDSDFALDPSIKDDNTYGPELLAALTQVPSLSLVMESEDLDLMHSGTLEFPTSVELIFPNGEKGEQANAGIERAGGSSFNSRKRNLRLSFKSIYGDSKFDFPIFGEAAAPDFDQIALRPGFHGCMHLGIDHSRGGSNDLADQVLRNLQGNIAKEGTSLNGSFMHLYINGVYWGVYNPSERGNDSFVESYYGGDKEDVDVIKRNGLPLTGTVDAWDTLNDMVDNLDLSDAANYEQVQEYVEVEQFTEYVIISNFGPHADDHPNGKNSFVTRDRTKTDGFRFWIWDTEPALGHYWSWNVADIGSQPYNNIFFSLLNNTDYRTLVGDKVECHCFNGGALTPEKTIEQYMKVYNSTNTAMLAEAARWVTKAEYTEFVNTKDRIVNEYLPNRTNDFVQLYREHDLYPSIDAVQFSQYGGIVDVDFQLDLTNPNTNGTIYYTTDGSDPRASGGGIATSATQYTGSLSLPTGVIEVKARIKNGSTWSAMCPRKFYVNQKYDQLVINEIHYNPTDSIFLNSTIGEMDTIDSKNFSYVELKNTTATPITLDGLMFTKGIELTIENAGVIPPGGFAVFAEDPEWFEARYGFAPDGHFSGKLDTDGEKITLTDPFGHVIDSVRYYNTNPWDEAPFTEGFSLELLNASLNNNQALNWFRSDNLHGTPKAENSRTCSQPALAIVINEINYNSDNENFDPGDWIELYNPNATTVDVSGWTFYDNGNAFVLPSGTSIEAASYLVLVEEVASFTNAFPLVNTNVLVGDIDFSLSNKGERISLFDANKCLVDYVIYNDKAPWPTAADGDGATLTLIDPILDNAIAPSWKASDELSTDFVHGSPGKSNICAGLSHTLVSSQIDGTTDDAEEKIADGSVSLSSGDLDLVNDGGEVHVVGLRFQNITIPQGATITSAVIEFVADEVNTVATNLLIQGEAIDDAPSFKSSINNISSRTKTTNKLTWEPEPWETEGENDIHQKTVDLSNIVQEIVDRPGFSAGNAMAFIIEGTGIRTAESFDGSSDLAPKLWITYTSGACGIQAKVLLEGFYDAATEEMHTKLQDKGLLPMLQPFNESPWNYTGTESTTTLPSDAVDWVLVASRNAEGTITNQAAGFIDISGNLLSVEGTMGIPIANAENQYFSIHTRSHLAILSANPYSGELYDFTIANTQALGTEQLKLSSGKYVLYAGDYDGNGIINNTDFNQWKIQSAKLNEYLSIDGDGNGIINSGDFNLWINNRSKIGEQVIRY